MPNMPFRVHHSAKVVKDLARSRGFYEGILGLPLVATWCETSKAMGDYCHVSFALQDGSEIALFQFARDDVYEKLKRPENLSAFHHLALKGTSALQDEIRAKADAAGVAHYTTDHGMCVSLYLDDPDGHKVEITFDNQQVLEQSEEVRSRAAKELQRWLAGDRTPNNEHRRGDTI